MLPLPRSWLSRPEFTGDTRSASDAVLSARIPRPGTLAHLHMALCTSGMDSDIVDIVLSKDNRTRKDLLLLGAESDKVDLRAIRDLGYEADMAETSTKAVTVWDSYTRYPFWVANSWDEFMVVSAPNWRVAQMMTGTLIHNLWQNLGEEPIERMPTFRRFNLTTFSDPQGIHTFQERFAATTDLVVMTAHYVDAVNVYRTLDLAKALSGTVKGLFVLELIAPPEVVDMAGASQIRPIFGLAKRKAK